MTLTSSLSLDHFLSPPHSLTITAVAKHGHEYAYEYGRRCLGHAVEPNAVAGANGKPAADSDAVSGTNALSAAGKHDPVAATCDAVARDACHAADACDASHAANADDATGPAQPDGHVTGVYANGIAVATWSHNPIEQHHHDARHGRH